MWRDINATEYGRCRFEVGVYSGGSLEHVFRTDAVDVVPMVISLAEVSGRGTFRGILPSAPKTRQ